MHGGADRVLGQGDFCFCGGVIHHAAGHGVIPVHCPLGGQRLHRSQPPSTGDHRVAPGTVRAGVHGAGNQVLEQAMGGDRSLEFGEGRGIGWRLAYIAGREFKLRQRDMADIAFGHMGLLDCGYMEPGGDTLSGIRPSPASGPARALAGAAEPGGQRSCPARARTVELTAAVHDGGRCIGI